MAGSTFTGLRPDLEAWLLAGASSPFILNEKDGSLLVLIPAGEFEMGDGKDDDNPKHRVYLDSYYLGAYCITNRQYKKFIDETGHRPPDKAVWGTSIWQGKSYPEGHAEHPVVCVSWEDAAAYCTWAGMQLPTEAQWEKGARGPSGLAYPWGNEWDEGICRHDGNKGSETTCLVFDYPAGASGYGTYNQSGNVREWCRDWYGRDCYSIGPRENPDGPATGSARVFRGGGWSGADAGGFRAAYRHSHDPAARNINYGFRACLSPGRRQVR